MIKTYTNQDKDFYSVMGRFLAKRSIVRELGEPLYDDDGKLWFVSFDGENVQGFASLTLDSVALLGSAYVLPGFRHTGVYKRLLDERLKYAREYGVQHARCVATQQSMPILSEYGFVITKAWKNYFRMELALRGNDNVTTSAK